MYPVSASLVRAWSSGYSVEVSCQARRGAAVLVDDLDVVGGGVATTDAPGVRAVLDLEVAPSPGLFDVLAPGGVQVFPVLRFRWGIEMEDVPLGCFDVEEQSLSYTDGGTVGLKGCPDLMGRVVSRRLDSPVLATGNAVGLASLAIRDGIGVGLTGTDVDRAEAVVADAVFDDKREDLIAACLAAANRQAYVDRGRRLVIRKPPGLEGPVVWSVDAYRSGTLVTAERTRSSRMVRNRIIVRPVGVHFPTQWVDDDDPTSPTWVGGPMGVRPRVLASPLIRNAEQARAAGRSLLARSTGLAASLTITTAPHWGLEPGDVIDVTLPAVGGDGAVSERHLVASVNLPLPTRGSAAVQQITTRSTNPDTGADQITAPPKTEDDS